MQHQASGATNPDRLGDWLIRRLWRTAPSDLAERTRRRVTVHLIPFLFLLYVLAYLDRSNVSVAQLGMTLPPEQQGLGFTDEMIGYGAGIFFAGYWILEIPSSLSVAKRGVRWVFLRIIILWGACATMCGLIGLPLMHSFFGWVPELNSSGGGLLGPVRHFITQLPTNPAYQFYFFRFLLGMFEGGFFPAVIVYLSHWFRAQDRGKAMASFMIAIPFAGFAGSTLSGLLLNVNWANLAGWRWVYLLEGVAPIFAGVAVIFLLPNRPHDAKWLPPDERLWLENVLTDELMLKTNQGLQRWAWVRHLGMVVLLAVR